MRCPPVVGIARPFAARGLIRPAGAVRLGTPGPDGACGRPQDLLDRGPLFIQVRAHGEAVPVATAKVENGELIVETAARIRGVAAGQAMVLYEGETVLGSATICRTGVQ
ncbi:MAG: hypothetical protein EBS42_15310 [Caulobacteraceae bacterium]|nr:hypothetical protein [Caulobacteraceae bacterium]